MLQQVSSRCVMGCLIMLLGVGLSPCCAWAEPRVVDQSTAYVSTAQAQSSGKTAGLSEQVTQLAQQMQNQQHLNLPGQLDSLQDKVQQLQGQVEELGHTLKTLQDKQNRYYKDMDDQLREMRAQQAKSEKQAKSTATANAMSAPKTEADKKSMKIYADSFKLLQEKHYTRARWGFSYFVKKYPHSPYAGNAHYWLGEIYYVEKKYKEAETYFSQLINQYPKHPKVADALLRQVLILNHQGKQQEAEALKKVLQSKYPNSEAANLSRASAKPAANLQPK